jgi:hypothetical protein
LFLARDKLLDGADIATLSYPTLPVNECQCIELLSDVEDEWDSFNSVLDDIIT